MEEVCPDCGSANVRLGDTADNTWDCMNCGTWFNPDHPEVKLAMLGKVLQVISWYLEEPNPITTKRAKELLKDAIALATE